MSDSIKGALDALEEEKGIKKEKILKTIEESLVSACTKHYEELRNEKKDGKKSKAVSLDAEPETPSTPWDIRAHVDPETMDIEVFLIKTVCETVTDEVSEISLQAARDINPDVTYGDTVRVDLDATQFCRIAAGQARQTITQKIREEEKDSILEEYRSKQGKVVTGTVQRFSDRDGSRRVFVNLNRTEGILSEKDQIPGEVLTQNQRIKVYVLEERPDRNPVQGEKKKWPRVMLSRSNPGLVRGLFESEIAEIRDGIVEVKAVSREAGHRSKVAVYSHDPNVDAVGSCVGPNGSRINSIIAELNDEKIDVVEWDENPALLIEHALAPASVTLVMVSEDSDDRSALVVVPDYQLSLAIGREGQNARLAAKLTGYKIDIKSYTQAKESGIFEQLELDDEYEGYGYEDYEEGSGEEEEYEEGEYEEAEEAAEDSAEESEE
ncbi:MAG: transcription termination/antitermination protein NusA [Lachnospiraceae bacterium]|nr:transcription termination/antitermination protein NusA [Lachnospiraceae bacterium]